MILIKLYGIRLRRKIRGEVYLILIERASRSYEDQTEYESEI